MKKLLFSLILLLTYTLAFSQALPFKFEAKGLLILSDADMLASAYADGYLGAEAGVEDSLTILRFNDSGVDLQKLHVPNSVTNWTNGLDLSNDQNTAFVIDTRLGLPRKKQQVSNVVSDLPAGHTLYAIDLRDPFNPTILDQIKIQDLPLSIAVNPVSGQLLITAKEKGKEVALIDWEEGRFGRPTYHDLKLDTAYVSHASWHPSGKYFGVTVEPNMTVNFYEMQNKHSFRKFGQAVKAGSYPGAGHFSKNGQYYLLPDLQWDKSYQTKGYMLSVKFDSLSKQHQLADKVEVGISPEGFALSPKGNLVAVSNMGTNFMPSGAPIFGKSASITLLHFDETTGDFKVQDTQSWPGILPEGIAFDNAGEMLAVSSFDRLDITRRGGYVSFWKVEEIKDGKFKLFNTGFQASITRGAHHIEVIR